MAGFDFYKKNRDVRKLARMGTVRSVVPSTTSAMRFISLANFSLAACLVCPSSEAKDRRALTDAHIDGSTTPRGRKEECIQRPAVMRIFPSQDTTLCNQTVLAKRLSKNSNRCGKKAGKYKMAGLGIQFTPRARGRPLVRDVSAGAPRGCGRMDKA